MRFLTILFFLFYFSFVCAYNDNVTYEFYSMKSSKNACEYRKSDFSVAYGDEIFEKKGLFIFYERLGVQRLYVMNYEHREDSIMVYQLPEIRLLPWINPEKYMKKRNQLLNSDTFVKKCKATIPSRDSLVAEIDSLHIDMHLFVRPVLRGPIKGVPDSLYSSDKNHVIMGFSQNEGENRYFYYMKYNGLWEDKGERFSVYASVFKVMEQLNKKIVLPDCK